MRRVDLAQPLHEVVGERIVVVDQQNHDEAQYPDGVRDDKVVDLPGEMDRTVLAVAPEEKLTSVDGGSVFHVLDFLMALTAFGRLPGVVSMISGRSPATAASRHSTWRIAMTLTFVTLSLALALGGTGQCPDPVHCPHRQHQHSHGHGYGHRKGSGGFILPPGPGDGWGFPNGNPDGYGWHDPSPYLPLGADRTAEYFYPRYFAVPPEQSFMGTYYNPYVNRGQRYLPYSGNGGDHPAGGAPLDSAETPVRPYSALTNDRPVVPVPRLRGRVEATPPDSSGKTGLTP